MSIIDRAVREGKIEPEMVAGVQGDKEATNNMGRYLTKIDGVHNRAVKLGSSNKVTSHIIKKVQDDIKKIKSKKKLTKQNKEQLIFYKQIYGIE